MLRLTMFPWSLTCAAVLLFAASAPVAFAESLWTVNTAKVRPGMLEKAYRFYEAGWLPARQLALNRGDIKSYRIVVASKESVTDAEVVLITEYPDDATFALREKNFAQIFERLGIDTKAIKIDGLARADIFEYVRGLEDYREYSPR